MRKVFLEDLPRRWIRTNQVDWVKCAELRCKVKGIYDGIEFELEILDYDGKHLYIKYQDKNVFKILTYSLQKCRFGKLLNKHTDEFKIKIGQTFKDDKRDIVITNRENKKDNKGNNKFYKYKCNKCGFDCGEHYSVKDSEHRKELWILEGNLIKGQGCSCCNNKVIVEGINSIVDTAPWMIPYFQNPNEAKIYAKSSNKKIIPICPDCGRVKDKEISINQIYNKKSIGCTCSDSIPYPEKFMLSVLKQLGINFKTQLNKTIFNWCKDYRYDFYFNLNNNKYIIENTWTSAL